MPFIPLEIFARAGGGGSSGGSGGGDGGIFVLGYLAGHGATSLCKRFIPPLAAFIAGCVASAVVAWLFTFWSPFIGVFEFLAGVGGAYVSYQGLLGKFAHRIKMTKGIVDRAAQLDPTWDEQSILDTTRQRFMDYQRDWENMAVTNLRTYVTSDYYKHVVLMLSAMRQMGRKNTMTNIKIQDMAIVQAIDSTDDTQDRISVAFAASAKDQLIDTDANKVLNTDTQSFLETWDFVRQGDTWLLSGITPSTADPSMMQISLKSFAEANGMYFSPDWGRLLIPTRGKLFGGASFQKSDINNHVIGVNNGNIIQLYTYGREFTSFISSSYDYFIIGQINLPKTYGGIIVQRKDAKLSRGLRKPPRDYRRVTLEWGDFNRRYDIYATAPDQVTSFELLDPSFMAWLYDQDIKVNIEVVDNVVYLYAKLGSQTENRYELMLDILHHSYKELKL